MLTSRAAGILLHPSSLPGPLGVGDLGRSVDRFLDWCVAAGQSVWQVLPLGPTGYGDSPYGSLSAFAGNPALISPELLVEDGLLTPDELRDAGASRLRVGPEWKEALFREIWSNFPTRGAFLRSDFDSFRESQKDWLNGWCLFRALKTRNGGRSWIDWEEPARSGNDPQALIAGEWEECSFVAFVQFLFFRQWHRVRREASKRGIRILGDVPIYVAYDSADVWANRELFRLNAAGRPEVVAGVPPDYFSATGQLWGNPLYDWDRMATDGYAWWIRRAAANLELVDLLRLDHFRGFAAFWEVPAGDRTAENGRWRTGPGEHLFAAITSALGRSPFLAEDLGLITPDVDELRRRCGFSGMRVLQFAFGEPGSLHLPEHYEKNTVAYTGTHDNPTVRQWYDEASTDDRKRMNQQLPRSREPVEWRFIDAVYDSRAALAIVPMQDVLGLGAEGRMNTPGKAHGNWNWRASEADFSKASAAKLRELVVKRGRVATIA